MSCNHHGVTDFNEWRHRLECVVQQQGGRIEHLNESVQFCVFDTVYLSVC